MIRLAALLVLPVLAGAQGVNMVTRTYEMAAADIGLSFDLILRSTAFFEKKVAPNGTFITATSAHVRGPSAEIGRAHV